MATCHECGLSMSENAAFCPTCFARVGADSHAPAETAPASSSAEWSPQADQPTAEAPYAGFEPYVDADPNAAAAPKPTATSNDAASIAIAATALMVSIVLEGPSLSSLPSSLLITAWWVASLFLIMRMFHISVSVSVLLWTIAICIIFWIVLGYALGLIVWPILWALIESANRSVSYPLLYIFALPALLVAAVVIRLMTNARFWQALVVVVVGMLGSVAFNFLLAAVGI